MTGPAPGNDPYPPQDGGHDAPESHAAGSHAPERRPPEGMEPGVAVPVLPGVTRIVAPNPGMMTGPGTNTYLIGSTPGPLALVDPGPDDDAHLIALLEAAGDRLGWILVTHTHSDHSPLARRLREATGAEVVAAGPAPPSRPVRPSAWPARPLGPRRPTPSGPGVEDSGVPHTVDPHAVDPHDSAFAFDRRLGDGEILDCGDFAIEAVHTPGHTSNHLCFEVAGTGVLFSGDHVMSGSTVVIAPPDGDMADYLQSLQKVRRRELRRIAPGHGGVIEDPAAVLDDYLRHRYDREAQILALLAGGSEQGTFTDQIVEAIYLSTPEDLKRVARFSVWAHLRKLAGEGRATSPDAEDPDAPWSLSSD